MIEVVLNTGSTVRQGAVIKGGRKMTDEYVQEAAYCELNSKDMAQVGNQKKVKVSTEVGDVTVYARIDEGVSVGEAFIPRGPWANTIISSNFKRRCINRCFHDELCLCDFGMPVGR